MKVRLERNWMREGYDVWFWDTLGRYTVVWTHDSAGWKTETVEDNTTETEPSLTLRPEMLEALLREAEQVIPASHATERHLKDAVAVRDRLLTLVEGAA